MWVQGPRYCGRSDIARMRQRDMRAIRRTFSVAGSPPMDRAKTVTRQGRSTWRTTHPPREAGEIASPPPGAMLGLGRPIFSRSRVCRPPRFGSNRANLLGSRRKRANTARNNGRDRPTRANLDAARPGRVGVTRTTLAAGLPGRVGITSTRNIAFNQPRRNIASSPTGLQPPDSVVRRVAATSQLKVCGFLL